MSASDPSAPGLPIAPGGGGVPTTRTVTAGTGLTGGGALSGDITIAASFGTTSGTVTQGNDSRVTGAAQKSANLSDIESASTARTNLGLGSLATASSVASTGISDSTTVGRSVLTATDAAAARTAIGAGTGTSSYVDPLTTNGDIVYRTGGATSRLAVGSTGYVLSVSGGAPTWSLPSAAITAASDGAAVLTAAGGVPATRTVAGTPLSADISAATLRSGLGFAASAAAPSTTPILDLSADSGVTDDGTGRCSSWVGGGSVGATFTAPSSGRRPLIVSQSLGGRKSLFFLRSRVDTLTTSYSASLDPATALTVVVVAVVQSSTASVIVERPYASTHTAPYADWWVYASGSNIDCRVDAATSSIAIASDSNLSAWRTPNIITYRLASGARKIRVSGYDVTTAASGASLAYTNSIGLRIGSNSSDAEAATMWLYRVRLYNTSLTDAQVAEVEAELAAYYGLSLAFV